MMIHADIFRKQFTPLNRLASILISRFLLNLQATEQKSTGVVSSTGSQVESAIFQRVIGSLGGEAEFGGDDDVNGIEQDSVRAENGRMVDIENRPLGIEHAEEDAVGPGADHWGTCSDGNSLAVGIVLIPCNVSS